MNRLAFVSLLVATSLYACSSGKGSSDKATTSSEEKAPVSVKGNRMLTLEIEGMTCVMGCGGTIRKELAETNAIESCEFEFEEGRAMNTAKISFDKDKISVDKIIQIVSTINKGQFKVGNNASEDISVNIKTTVQDVPSDHADEGKMKVTAPSNIEMPNLVEILASFFHN